MKLNIPFPDEKITWFKEKIGIEQDDFKKINKFSHLFINNKSNFSHFFFNYFSQINETDFFLKHQEHGVNISGIWREWFASFFRNNFDYKFLKSLWKSGLRHVEINIDHRFITLSYSVLRQFCQDLIRNEIPIDEQKSVTVITDKMIDLCLLVETHAFVEATSRCDMEVVRGISHQVRNPITVIGGNVMKLMRSPNKDGGQKDIQEIGKTIIEESKRLERMVIDAAVYSDMFQKEADYSIIPVSLLLSNAFERINELGESHIKIKKEITPGNLMTQGDKDDLETMFFKIFQHCIDTAGQCDPDIKISVKQNELSSSFIELEILNKGIFGDTEEIQNAFVPFYSSRPAGTGFGLAIARLAARKSLGDIYLEVLPDVGMKYIVKLPTSKS